MIAYPMLMSELTRGIDSMKGSKIAGDCLPSILALATKVTPY